ncbi:nuclear transport factor 2 family protein [Radicibacter daui]|uniref:nuclear transport factor 2 family protein n=1 Tax=Radicibacter daui TaxID=3064829 RepID=UPI0040469494
MTAATGVTKSEDKDATLARDAETVRLFLETVMIPDPESAMRYVASGMRVTFTGGREMTGPADTAAFNARRYKWVKKRMERTDVAGGDGHTVVYNLGTLYGEWPDGTPFEGNRYVDRYEVTNGLITRMEVWNDSAERILMRMGVES